MEVLRLDLASELRLRRWARLNYVSPDRRPASWHPIVLAEMRCRDAELGDLPEPSPPGARYVPIAPTVPTATGPDRSTW
ncbi:MAG TPA: hypothetical protein VGP76_30790 [Planctomycetaceae bacterium]|nr:hypothetical protein [Planctomycetaceae bacterium]